MTMSPAWKGRGRRLLLVVVVVVLSMMTCSWLAACAKAKSMVCDVWWGGGWVVLERRIFMPPRVWKLADSGWRKGRCSFRPCPVEPVLVHVYEAYVSERLVCVDGWRRPRARCV